MNITELIEKVREIDEESADYMEGDAKNLGSYNEHPRNNFVSSLFFWIETPQGYEHWEALDDLLRG